MRLALVSVGLASGLGAGPVWAVPSNFGHPYPVPARMFAAALVGQYQVGEGLTAGLGGAYGLNDRQGFTFSATRSPEGTFGLGVGAGSAFYMLGSQAKIAVSASQALVPGADLPAPAGAVALDIGRQLGERVAVFGELGTALSAGGGAALKYASSVEFALTPWASIDLEYLGGLSARGRSGVLSTNLAMSFGRGQLTGTVLVPREPVPADPVYLVGTTWILTP